MLSYASGICRIADENMILDLQVCKFDFMVSLYLCWHGSYRFYSMSLKSSVTMGEMSYTNNCAPGNFLMRYQFIHDTFLYNRMNYYWLIILLHFEFWTYFSQQSNRFIGIVHRRPQWINSNIPSSAVIIRCYLSRYHMWHCDNNGRKWMKY